MSAEPTATDEPTIDARLRVLEQEVQDLREEKRQQDERIDELEETVEEKDERIDELESELQRLDGNINVAINKGSTNADRIQELQGRELEKGAHLLEENVPKGDKGEGEYAVDVADGRLEKIQKEDGQTYLRIPESDDPLGRGGSAALSHGDLLPIQQLAQMDEDMLQRTADHKGDLLAAKLWKARVDPNVGDNPWKKGAKDVREYVSAGEMKHWIRRQMRGVSDDYAKKLVSRTIEAMKDLTKNRIAITKRSNRKNGLKYKERKVEIRTDTDIPGETTSEESSPETAGVLG